MSFRRTTAAVFAAVSLSLVLIRAAAADAQPGAVFVRIPLNATAPSGPDAIDNAIAEARARGLRVHATIQPIVAARAGELPPSRAHVIYRHPEWLMVPRELALELRTADVRTPDYLGRLVRWARAHAERGAALYLSPLQPESVDYIATSVARVVSRYPVDGVHLENLSLPGDDFDFSRQSTDAFRQTMRSRLPAAERARLDDIEALDPFGYLAEFPDDWRRFRVTRLTALVARVRAAVRAIRPDVIVSASVVRGADRAMTEYFQDWRTWLDNGFVDALSAGAGGALVSSYETLIESGPATESH